MGIVTVPVDECQTQEEKSVTELCAIALESLECMTNSIHI